MCLYCVSKVSAKAVVEGDLPAYTLSIHKHNALRITKGNNSNKIGPLYIINVHLVDINVFAKSDEIPSLSSVRVIKEKPK